MKVDLFKNLVNETFFVSMDFERRAERSPGKDCW